MTTSNPSLDFSNTEIAFSHFSDAELKKTAWLFSMMNKPWLVNYGSALGLIAIRWNLPFAETVIRKTIFEHFCGGTSLEECRKTIDHLFVYNTLTILDYGAEAKETEADFDKTMNQTLKGVEFASQSKSIPMVSTKITGMARFGLLEKINAKEALNAEEKAEFDRVIGRVDKICQAAFTKGVGVLIDAEESWIQDPIDDMVDLMMSKYNKSKVVVYNTFQMYRNDRLDFLKASFQKSQQEGYLFGAKLVRGAYMEKERKRAEEMGYPSPINPDKASTDEMYNAGMRFCIENYEKIGSCNATHNAESSMMQARLIDELGLPKNHPHLNFCQLLGMSDNITFNLAKAGYNVAKYLPYGTVKEVVPYLIRRARENTSVTGDMSREYQLISKEVRRRGL